VRIVDAPAFVSLIMCLAPTAIASQLLAQQRVPVPDAAAQQAARKVAAQIFGGRFTQAKTTAQKTALATEVIDAAMKVQDGSADQYALLKIAADIAAGAGDAPTALQAVEKLAERFEAPGPKLTAESLLAAARNASLSSQRKAIGEAALNVVDALADADEYELALRLCKSARASTLKGWQYALAKELAGKAEAIRQCQDAFREYQNASSVLDTNPSDPAANLAAARYECFVKGDWGRGVAKFALGSDPALKDVAIKDLRGLTGSPSAEQQVAIGDAWWALAEAKVGCERDKLRLRAGSWYQQAESKLSGALAALKVKERLADIAKLGREIPKLTEAATGLQHPPLAIAPFDEATAKQHQAAWAKHLGVPVDITNSIGMRFALIPPGEFDMGSSPDLIDQLAKEAESHNQAIHTVDALRSATPRHRVRLTKPFYVGVCEVTQTEFEQVMGSNPSKFKQDPNCPVEMVAWGEVTAFCSKLTELPRERAVGAEYRLLTEAEWEYACRAGTTTQYSFGDNPKTLTVYGWWLFAPQWQRQQRQPQPVGRLRPNAWGLYDMHGNAWELCQDWWGEDYYGTSPVADPTGPASGSRRLMRGGAVTAHKYFCLSSSRRDCGLGERYSGVGFRVARTVSSSSAPRQ
jgi:formylglycine-generating enzyme required for sulfatase activity